jgi:hypothetical protein
MDVSDKKPRSASKDEKRSASKKEGKRSGSKQKQASEIEES